MYEICYISIPLYNTSTYAFADDDQKAEMLSLIHILPAAGQHRRMGKGKGAPGGQMARQHLYDAFCGPHIPAHDPGVTLVGTLAGEGGGTLGRSGKQGDGIGPVSYTHLDVYKRQE